MKRGDALRALVAGVHADHGDYQALRRLLDAQFDAALRHDSTELQTLGGRIAEQVGVLDTRRRERMRLVGLLGLAAPVAMEQVIGLFAQNTRDSVLQLWQALQALVAECKALNLRNCRLMMDQHALMQRVLEGEADTYAPR